jgi:hypothetical protein
MRAIRYIASRLTTLVQSLISQKCILNVGWLIVSAGVFVATTNPAFANENFNTDLTTEYRVNTQAISTVEHHFTITNKTPTYFINRYGLKLSSKGITNVTVIYNNQTIPAEVVQDQNFTSVGINFPDKVVGEGKKLAFTVRYQNHDSAQLNGKVLEVTIPELANASEYTSYSINLVTPAQFGTPVRSTPEPSGSTQTNQFITTSFRELKGAGVSAIFGSTQVYQLNLQYQLENPGSQPILTQITLPPDTPYQRLQYQKIDPLPQSIKTDGDGNWIATYRLEPNADIRVLATALAQVRLEPDQMVPSVSPILDHFTDQDYWDTTDSELRKKAAPLDSPLAIYQSTVDTLTYTTEPITSELKRYGAIAALNAPNDATCQEFTDLFITLARINGIASRRATGYAYTKNDELRPVGVVGDILHAWPEYYDSEAHTWRPIDPTWGDTTGGVDYFHQFDLNHIVFAYQGLSSTLPYPAGSYRPGTKPDKLVDVQFANEFPELEPNLEITIEPKKISLLTVPGFYELTIVNKTGMAWYNLTVTTDHSETNTVLIGNHTQQPTHILPYQTVKIPVTAYNTNQTISADQTYQFYVNLANQPIASGSTALITLPAVAAKLGFNLFLLGLAGSIVTLTLTTGSLLILWRKWRHTLRR